MAPPGFNENLGFLQGVEDLPVQELVAQPCVEALDVAVLPRRTRFDEGGPGADRGDPLLDGPGDELRAVVGADVSRDGAQDEQIGQHIDDVNRGELSPNPDRQALPGELVQDIARAEGPGVIGPVMHEVIRPDMVRALGAQPDTGSVVEPEPAPLRLTSQSASRSRAAIRR